MRPEIRRRQLDRWANVYAKLAMDIERERHKGLSPNAYAGRFMKTLLHPASLAGKAIVSIKMGRVSPEGMRFMLHQIAHLEQILDEVKAAIHSRHLTDGRPEDE